MSQFHNIAAFDSSRHRHGHGQQCANRGCGQCGCGGHDRCGHDRCDHGRFFDDECFMVLGDVIDDTNLSPNCSCHFRCCICGGWCGFDCKCVRCGNVCINNCDRDDSCGCSRGRICLRKVDVNDRTVLLAGAEFELRDSCGVTIAIGTTDADGELCFHDLRNGTYFLRETTAPTGYRLNADVTAITLTAFENRVFLEITNTPMGGDITVIARSASNPAIIFPGINVSLINSAMQSVATAMTDATGVARFTGIGMGTYTLIPLNVPAGYVAPGIPTQVTVSAATPNPTAVIGFMQIP